ncbi:MAG: HNH endonuclease signature motif containing protein, partial [Microthrixaceae bacterium]
ATDGRVAGELAMPSRAQLRADALVDLVRAGAAAVNPVATAAEVTLVIPVDHPALRGDSDASAAAGPAGATDAAGPDGLGAGDLDLLLCDPVVRALVVDSLGVPLDLGRSVRFATRDQRRALAARDGGCVFPGCGAPASWTDAHHVVRFADGGGTDLSNLASLCRHHHGVVHRRGWTMSAAEGQRFTFTTPRGLVLRSQRHGRRGQDSS